MISSSKILIAGAHGLVGSAITRELQKSGFTHLLTPQRQEVDFLHLQQVENYFSQHRPEYLYIAAAKVGGIHANNTFPVEFMTENLQLELNLIQSAWKHKVNKLLFLGSSCIYPKLAKQPIQESELLNGPLEPTNSAYAVAKIAGIQLCQSYHKQYGANYISVMPTNLYGPKDNYHPENSHVIPGLIRRFHQAKIDNLSTVSVWGSGKPLREFLYSDDLARACVFLMKNYNQPDIINVGSPDEVSIHDLATIIAETVGYKGTLIWDSSKPDGTPRKKLDCEKIFSLGWRPTISLREGLQLAYQDFLESHS